MAKRTYEQSLTFFKRNTKQRGEGRELYKTPYNMIRKIVPDIIQKYPYLKDYLWIDPCAGDGRWEEVIKEFGIKCESYDINPLNTNVKQQDFLTADYKDKNIFIIGNPPFSLLKKFVEKALSLCDICYFLGGSQVITGTLSNRVDYLHRFEGVEGNQKDKRSKIGFEDTLGKEVYVWCCGAVFTKEEHKPFIRQDSYFDGCFRTSVKCFCKEDERVNFFTK